MTFMAKTLTFAARRGMKTNHPNSLEGHRNTNAKLMTEIMMKKHIMILQNSALSTMSQEENEW